MADQGQIGKGWRREARGGIGTYIRAGFLLLACAVQVVITIIGVEPPWRTDWFDLMQRLFPRPALTAPEDSQVRIVALQQTNDDKFDRFDWTRDRIARVVHKLNASGARVIGLDFRLDGLGIAEIAEMNANNAIGIVLGPEKTLTLADAVREANVVAPVSLYSDDGLRPPYTRRIGAPNSGADGRTIIGDGNFEQARALIGDAPLATEALRAHPAIVNAAASEGLIPQEFSFQSVTRRMSLIQLGEEGDGSVRIYFSMAIELLRLFEQQEHVTLGPAPLSAAEIRIGPRIEVPVDSGGEMRLHLRKFSPLIYRDATQVFSEPPDPGFFGGKIVIISQSYGFSSFSRDRSEGTDPEARGSYLGLMDTALFDTRMTAELIGQIVEQGLTGSYMVRPDWMPWAEAVIMLVLGTFLNLVFPRYNPSIIGPVTLIIVLMNLPISAVLFSAGGVMYDGAGVTTACLFIGSVAFGTTLVDRDRQHQDVQRALWAEQADKSRLEGELDVARRIQMGLLPAANATPVAGLEIACHIKPARLVSGDFYDHIVRPDGRFFFLIADVSGKGAPASLFMALSKSQWKSAALRRESLAQVQALANREISRDNADAMFVTGVGCMYDPDTGTLGYCGAGHDMPVLARPGHRAVALPEASGPPMGLDSPKPYAEGNIGLKPGDLVCLFTDGLSEAELSRHPDGRPAAPGELLLFGAEGVALALERAAEAGDTAAQAIDRLLTLLDEVTGAAEQTDDRTVVIVRALPADAGTD